jgi:Flp pilus assembly protein TadD
MRYLTPAHRSIDPSVEGRRAGISLISHAAAPPTPRAYQSVSTLTGITATLLLLLASCTERSLSDSIPLQPPAPALSAWKPNLHLADTALSGGAPAIALQISDELLAKNSHDAGALVRRGDALTALGRPSEAAPSYNSALEIEPKNSRALVGLGRVRLPQDPAAAEALFARVVTLDPNDTVALCDLGVARDLQGHHADAQEAYRMALGAAPTSISAQVNMGLSMALSGNADGAVRLLQPLAAAPDAAPRVREDFALALALSGHRNEASAMLGRDLPPDQVRGALDAFEALRP